jgi:hypothetical protein
MSKFKRGECAFPLCKQTTLVFECEHCKKYFCAAHLEPKTHLCQSLADNAVDEPIPIKQVEAPLIERPVVAQKMVEEPKVVVSEPEPVITKHISAIEANVFVDADKEKKLRVMICIAFVIIGVAGAVIFALYMLAK